MPYNVVQDFIMAKNIIDYPLTDSVFMTVFSENKNTVMSLSRSGTMVFGGKYVATEFSNMRKQFNNHELLGYIGKPTYQHHPFLFSSY
jgi:hypothetical protein